MARTRRAETLTPSGWTVRDGNHVFWDDIVRSGIAHHSGQIEIVKPWPKAFNFLYRKECRKVRRWTYRRYRGQINYLMRQGRYDELPRPPKTGRWYTW